MADSDATIKQVLASASWAKSDHADRLDAWWQRERQEDQTLTGFLIAKGVISEGGARTLDMLARGYLNSCPLEAVFSPLGVDCLRKLGEEPATQAAQASPADSSVELDPQVDTTTQDIPSGTRFGDVIVFDVSQRTKNGPIYRAFHIERRSLVAFHTLPAVPTCATARGNFRDPRIEQVHAFREDPSPYAIAEVTVGLSLREAVASWTPFDTRATLRLGLELASLLKDAAESGLRHGSIDPDHVVLSGSSIKLLGFGFRDGTSLDRDRRGLGETLQFALHGKQSGGVSAKDDDMRASLQKVIRRLLGQTTEAPYADAAAVLAELQVIDGGESLITPQSAEPAQEPMEPTRAALSTLRDALLEQFSTPADTTPPTTPGETP